MGRKRDLYLIWSGRTPYGGQRAIDVTSPLACGTMRRRMQLSFPPQGPVVYAVRLTVKYS